MTARDVDFEKERSLLQAMAEGAAGGLDTDLLRSQGLGGTKRVLTTPVGEQGPPKALRRRQKSTNRFDNGENSSPSDPSDAEDQLDDLHRCPYDVSGCKEVFLSLAELDQHVGSKHVPRRVTDPATLADLGALKKAVLRTRIDPRGHGQRSPSYHQSQLQCLVAPQGTLWVSGEARQKLSHLRNYRPTIVDSVGKCMRQRVIFSNIQGDIIPQSQRFHVQCLAAQRTLKTVSLLPSIF